MKSYSQQSDFYDFEMIFDFFFLPYQLPKPLLGGITQNEHEKTHRPQWTKRVNQ
jgi:hypothetical protein